MASNKAPLVVPFIESAGLATVKIEVGTGPAKKTFTVHKKLLCDKMEYFDKMFNGGFAEGTTQSATMPEDDPNAFASLLGWIYLQKIETFMISHPTVTGKQFPDFARYIRLFALAEKYNVPSLADDSIKFLVDVCISTAAILNSIQMRLCYELSHAESKLRVLASRMLAYTILCTTDKVMSDVIIHKVMVEVPDLGKTVVTLCRNQSQKAFPDPRRAPACDYHQHAKGDKYPYKSPGSW